MKLYQRVCRVLADEGMSGLARRVVRKVFRTHQPPDTSAAEVFAEQAEYARLVEEFNARVRERNLGDLGSYYWYHTIDLGDGLVTPGDYDYRPSLPAFGFPDDMRGMTVLDVGAATGFFSFEFERRGATVVSVDLPSVADWDIVAVERQEKLRLLADWHRTGDATEADSRHLDGPFQFCHRMLGSSVRRCYSRIYDLTPQKLGIEKFDVIFLGDVLPHIFSPLAALDVLWTLCKGKLIISNDLSRVDDSQPALYYTGGRNQVDGRSWWRPNRLCLEMMLKRVGFAHVEEVGSHRGFVRRRWGKFHRTVFHAHKAG